jgi:hypothetical protein
MYLPLTCPHCLEEFELTQAPQASHVLDSLEDQGPWLALGDGETVEDVISAALDGEEGVRCPECGDAIPVSEERLGQLTLELLSQW